MQKELGYGVTPIDISIQNWALKYARAYVTTLLFTQGKYASSIEIGRMAKEAIKTNPKWIERARDKVMGKRKGRK